LNYYDISIEGNLTSYVFYNTLLKKLHDYYKEDGKNQLIFDFSNLKTIEALVIPNLLCIGYIIKQNSGLAPGIYIADNINTGYLKKYINDIGFVSFAEKFNLFKFQDSIKDGLDGKEMDRLNTTIFFDRSEDEGTTWFNILNSTKGFADKYLSEFNIYDGDENPNNLIVEICKEVVENSKKHGKSFAFMTLQYNYRREKVYIAISDCGIGFKNSINEKIENKNLENQITENNVSDEIQGIIQGIYARAKSKTYGLYNVIAKTLYKEGTVRIHSMDTQLVLTENLFWKMSQPDKPASLVKIISNDEVKQNVRSNLKYGGVHIEIEIPLRRSEINRTGDGLIDYNWG
jgi:hypothetical protein